MKKAKALWLRRDRHPGSLGKEAARIIAAIRAHDSLVALARVRERRAYVKRMRDKRRAWLRAQRAHEQVSVLTHLPECVPQHGQETTEPARSGNKQGHRLPAASVGPCGANSWSIAHGQ